MAEEKEVEVHGPGLLGCDCLTGCANCGGKEEWKVNEKTADKVLGGASADDPGIRPIDHGATQHHVPTRND